MISNLRGVDFVKHVYIRSPLKLTITLLNKNIYKITIETNYNTIGQKHI